MGLIIIRLKSLELYIYKGRKLIYVYNKGFFKIFETLI
jgi:hypothetical protein